MKKTVHKNSKKIIVAIAITACLILFTFVVAQTNRQSKIITTSSTSNLSNKKIGWGIKREDNHKQPDLGATNKKIIEQYDGICMGNSELPYVYLTFDNGYEAGYTEKILDVLKENQVPAAFFITGHYVNTQPELVKRMIDEGHIVGNHIPVISMYLL